MDYQTPSLGPCSEPMGKVTFIRDDLVTYDDLHV